MNNTLRQFAAVGFGFAAFIIAFTLGTAVTMSTGIPLSGGLVNGVITSAVLTIGMLAINRFGTATWMWLTFGLLAIPTTTLGPPGFYKPLIGVVAGLIWDLIYWAFRRSRVGLFVGAWAGAAAIMGLLIAALAMGFGDNAAEALAKYKSAIAALLIINVVVTGVGVWLGQQIYVRRLAKISFFANLSASSQSKDQ